LSIAAWIVAVLAGLALVITALAQLRRVRPVVWLKRHDAIALIPAWTFFAPNPGTRDLRLLWRQRYPDGSVSPWHETAVPDPGPWRAIWNPHKRLRKAVTDICPSIVRRAHEFPESQLTVVSVPYLMVANHICSLPGALTANARQFLIAYTHGSDDHPWIQFISHWHALEAPAPDAPAEGSAPGDAAARDLAS
jgi:hypothetical protein